MHCSCILAKHLYASHNTYYTLTLKHHYIPLPQQKCRYSQRLQAAENVQLPIITVLALAPVYTPAQNNTLITSIRVPYRTYIHRQSFHNKILI